MKKLTAILTFTFFLFTFALGRASQNGLVVPDGTGASVRAGFNNAIDSLNTHNSGASAPVTTEAYMFWVDTANSLLKMRDPTNSTWIVLGALSAYFGLTPAEIGAEPAITAGTTSQYWRGDKTWQTLNLAALGYTVGTGANDLVQLNGSGQLPAVSGALLTNLPSTGGISNQNPVTSSRSLGSVYQNTNSTAMFVSVSALINSGILEAYTDSSSSPTTTVAETTFASGNFDGILTLSFWVLPGNYYKVGGSGTYTLEAWTEWH